MPCAASGAISRNGVPGSSSICTRSRGSSLPRATWLARAASPPPAAALRELRVQVVDQRAHGGGVGLEVGGAGVELGLQGGHVVFSRGLQGIVARQPCLAAPAGCPAGCKSCHAPPHFGHALRAPATGPPPPPPRRWRSPEPSWRAYRRHGQDPAQALELAQITPAQLQQARRPHHRAPDGDAVRRGDAGAGRRRPGRVLRKLPWGSYGMLARASLTAPDLGVALKRWCRHHALLTDDIRLTLSAAARAPPSSSTSAPTCGRPGRPRASSAWSSCCATSTAWPAGTSIRASRCRARSFPFPAPPHADAYAPHVSRRRCSSTPRRPRSASTPATWRCRCGATRRRCAQMLQRALPLTVLQYRRDRLLVPQVRQALAAHPGAGAQRRGAGRAAARVGAHAAPPAEGGRREPAAAEGRGAAGAGEGTALAQRQAGEAGGGGGGLSQREELRPRVPPVDRGQPGGVSAGCREYESWAFRGEPAGYRALQRLAHAPDMRPMPVHPVACQAAPHRSRDSAHCRRQQLCRRFLSSGGGSTALQSMQRVKSSAGVGRSSEETRSRSCSRGSSWRTSWANSGRRSRNRCRSRVRSDPPFVAGQLHQVGDRKARGCRSYRSQAFAASGPDGRAWRRRRTAAGALDRHPHLEVLQGFADARATRSSDPNSARSERNALLMRWIACR